MPGEIHHGGTEDTETEVTRRPQIAQISQI